MLTIDMLRSFGANVEEGLGRCMNNEAFYLRLVGKVLDDASFGKLETALAAGDLTAAFEAAHALKGVLGNLSLTPIFEPASRLTELLRSHTEGDYDALLRSIQEERSKLAALAE
jgi:HPt (histidine-containing phosphotransfer) domain-containing protein